MKRTLRPILALGILALILPGPIAAQGPKPLTVGVEAPDFSLPAASREGIAKLPVRLSQFKGQTVVLAFFYQARTSG